MGKRNGLFAFALSMVAIALIFGSAAAAHAQSVVGHLDIEFEEILDQYGDPTGDYSYVNHIGTGISLDQTLFSVPISIKSSKIGSGPLYWSDPGNWDNPVLHFTNAVDITTLLFGAATGHISVGSTVDGVNALINGGPTEKSFTASTHFTSDQVPGWQLDLGVTGHMGYDVTIPLGADMLMNQAAVLESLTVDSGTALSGNTGMLVRGNLTNRGDFYYLAGEITGNLINSGVAVVHNGQVLRIVESATIDGELSITEGSVYSDFYSGSGDIHFVGTDNSTRRLTSTNEFMVGSGLSVSGGSGTVSGTFTNRGLISSDEPGTITLSGNWTNEGTVEVTGESSYMATSGAWSSTGTMRVIDGGCLTLHGTGTVSGTFSSTNSERVSFYDTVTNYTTMDLGGGATYFSGVINNNGTLDLTNADGSYYLSSGASISGGVISGAGILIAGSSAPANLVGVRLDADARITGSRSMEILNGLKLNGTLEIAGLTQSNATLCFVGDQSLTGSGQVAFNTNSSPYNILRSKEGVLTIAPEMTIRGQGGTVTGDFINQGVISSDEPGTITLSGNWTNEGTVEAKNGGHVAVQKPVVLAGSGNFVVASDGRIAIGTSGSLPIDGEICVRDNGVLVGEGILIGSIVNVGLVSPGNSPGLIEIDGSYVQTGTLDIEIFDTAEFDVLDVTGSASLGGTLQVSLLGEGNIFSGDTFEFLSAGSREGEFDDVILPTLSSGEPIFSLTYESDGVTLTALETVISGDSNGDHIIDGLDYANLVAQFGGAPGDDNADFNYDNFVDLEDFAILRGRFGYGVESAPDAELGATTPEPATMALLGLGGLALIRRRWRTLDEKLGSNV